MTTEADRLYSWEDVVLAWQIGRYHIPPGSDEAFADLMRRRGHRAPAATFEERVAARAARTDGRPDYPGGPVDWETGQPLAH